MKSQDWRFGAPMILGVLALVAVSLAALQGAHAENKIYLQCGGIGNPVFRLIVDYDVNMVTRQVKTSAGGWAPVLPEDYQMPARISDREISWQTRGDPNLWSEYVVNRLSGGVYWMMGGPSAPEDAKGVPHAITPPCAQTEAFQPELATKKF